MGYLVEHGSTSCSSFILIFKKDIFPVVQHKESGQEQVHFVQDCTDYSPLISQESGSHLKLHIPSYHFHTFQTWE